MVSVLGEKNHFINEKLVYSVYAFYSTTLLSSAFGTAVTVSLLYVLFIVCLVFLVRCRTKFTLLPTDKLIFALVIWMFITNFGAENFGSGVYFIIFEYRSLWMAPVIAFSLSLFCSLKKIIIPLLVGLLFNIGGHVLILSEHFSPFDYFAAFVGQLGLEPRVGDFDLNGKFVYAIVVILLSGLICFALRKKLSSISRNFVGVSLLIGIFVIINLHSVIFVNARSGFAGSIIVLGVFFCLNIFHAARSGIRGFGLFAAIVLLGLGFFLRFVPHGLDVAFENAYGFLFEERYRSSVGQRLMIWFGLSEFGARELLFGVATGDVHEKMVALYGGSDIGSYFIDWRDLHSQYLWLIFQCGVFGLALYVVLAVRFLSAAISEASGIWYAALGIALFAVLLGFGLFNSIFTALREGHLVGLLVIAWSVFARVGGHAR